MRTCITLVIILIHSVAMGQDWALINPAYRYNYSDDGTDTISHQIKVIGSETFGADSTVHDLNKTAEYCWYPCWTECALQLGIEQFLQRSCTIIGDQWRFQGTNDLTIRSKAAMNEQWNFRAQTESSATVVSIHDTILFGALDSVRTMVTDLGDTVSWSKDHGVILWHMYDGPRLELVGINGSDVGVVVPSPRSFFRFHPGDIVQFKHSYGNLNHNASNFRHHVRFNIAERMDTDSSILFTGTSHEITQYYTNQFGTPSFGPYTWRIDLVTDSALSAFGSSPNEFVQFGRQIQGISSWPMQQAVVSHSIDVNGHYVIESDNGGGLYGVFSGADPLSESCQPINGQNVNSYYRLDGELGIRYVTFSAYYYYDIFETLGAVIDGDTLGTFSNDTFFHVGLIETDQTRSHVFPNPASDHLQIVGAQPGSDLIITDLHGRAVVQQRVSQSNEGVEVGSLPPGVYILRMEGYPPQRFVVAR